MPTTTPHAKFVNLIFLLSLPLSPQPIPASTIATPFSMSTQASPQHVKMASRRDTRNWKAQQIRFTDCVQEAKSRPITRVKKRPRHHKPRHRSPRCRRTGFLHLPFELRIKVYEYCIPQGHTINVLKPWLLYQAKKMLLVSRQVTVDVLDLLFTRNTFELPLNAEGETALGRNFSAHHRFLMRSLLVTIVPIGKSYGHSKPDVSLWATMIPHLTSLQIIASLPIPPLQNMSIAPNRWYRWVARYFNVFTRYVRPSTKVLLDFNGQQAACDAAREFLPSRAQFVRLQRGDLIFLRGIYSRNAMRFARFMRQANVRPRL